ncbi:hypothetical protein K402DRAFT_458207 [Aulographum hederae CBS 113979]|uniref:Uncharacterized protein n=1 Tax=Aulographum hederae CBS 113979 TaxID=1176131 RepID=A0A6G1GKE7_9PEZI|nr:hypothetical protein K402DRAFT_458207 [Aulographum hederae CBS 113979]
MVLIKIKPGVTNVDWGEDSNARKSDNLDPVRVNLCCGPYYHGPGLRAITQVSMQLRKESKSLYYANNKFLLESRDLDGFWNRWMHVLGPASEDLRHVRIEVSHRSSTSPFFNSILATFKWTMSHPKCSVEVGAYFETKENNLPFTLPSSKPWRVAVANGFLTHVGLEVNRALIKHKVSPLRIHFNTMGKNNWTNKNFSASVLLADWCSLRMATTRPPIISSRPACSHMTDRVHETVGKQDLGNKISVLLFGAPIEETTARGRILLSPKHDSSSPLTEVNEGMPALNL